VLALLVEANGIVRFKLTVALEQEGYKVLWAANVEEAAKTSRDHHLDLLLVDLNQPLKPGGEFSKRLKPLNPGIPMVLITEHKAEIEPAAAGHLVAVLEKPFRLAALVDAMNALLDRVGQIPAQRVSSGPVASHVVEPTTSNPAQEARTLK